MAKAKSIFRFSKLRFILFVIIAAVLGVSMLFSAQIENYYQQLTGNVKVISSTEILDNSKLSIHYVNVGQGDCIMINLPDNKNMIIDAGQKNGSKPIYSNQTESNDIAITNHVINYAKANIIKEGEKFDYMVLTHAHEDHVSILDNVLEEFEVGTIVRSPEFYQNTEKDAALTAKESELATSTGVTLKADYNITKTNTMRAFLNDAYAEVESGATMMVTSDAIQFSGLDADGNEYKIKFYTIPQTEYYNPTKSGLKNNPNNYSPLIILTYKEFAFAFTGDGEKESEKMILEKYGTLPNVDFMDLAHHGSKTGNVTEFIEALDPEYAIVAVGKHEIYGLPDEEVYERLKQYDAEIANKTFETIKYGDIVIGLNYTPSAEASSQEGETLASGSNMAIGISSGEYIQATVIKWWHVALGLIVLAAIILFLAPKTGKKVVKRMSKKS